MNDTFEHNYDASDDESEIAQQHSLHIHKNAEMDIRRKIMGVGTSHCIDCGEEIPEKRKMVAPWATRCVYCQEVHERG